MRELQNKLVGMGYKIDINSNDGIYTRILAYKGAHIIDIYKSNKYDVLALGYMGEYYWMDGFRKLNDIPVNQKIDIIEIYNNCSPIKDIVNRLPID